MTNSIRDKIIIATANLTKPNRARDLAIPVGSDEHNIIHVLYGLNRSGLIGFQKKRKGNMQQLFNIRLTKQGEERLKELQP